MRNLSKDNITEAFLKCCNQDDEGGEAAKAATPNLHNPRILEIMACLAKHLHAFALETKLTHDEWSQGVDFLKRVGTTTTPERDEFVLLSDVLGLSSLVDMIDNNRADSPEPMRADDPDDGKHAHPSHAINPTSSSVLGPFHLPNPPKLPMGADLKRDNGGDLVLVQGTVLDAVTGKPIAGASVNVWQTASNGLYSSQDPDQDLYNFHGLFSSTAEDGGYEFTTAKPVPYQIPTDGPVGELLRALRRHAWRPSHLHFIVEAEGYSSLVTEIFPDDDPFLDSDAVFGVRDDLVLTYAKSGADCFPHEGFDLSGKVQEDFLQIDFDLILSPSVA